MDAKVSCRCGNTRIPSQCCLLKISSKPWSGNGKKVTIAQACILLKQAINQRNLVLAQKISNSILLKVTNHPTAHFATGMQYFLQGKHQAAKSSLGLAFKNGLQDANAYLQYANIVGQEGNYIAALEHIKHALKLKPDFEPALIMGFQIAMLIQYFGQAIDFAKQILNLNTQNPIHYLYLAEAHSKNLQDELALEVIEQGLILDVKNSALLLLQASILEIRNELDIAIAVIQKVLTENPESIDAKLLQSTLLIRQKRAREAKSMLLSLIKNPNCNIQQIQKSHANLVKVNQLLNCYTEAWKSAEQMNLLDAKIRPSVGQWSEIDSYFTQIEIAADSLNYPTNSAKTSYAHYLFIVGFPRCGSTLLEKLLYQHFQCQTVGESKAIPELEKDIYLHSGKPWWQLQTDEWNNPQLLAQVENTFDVYKPHGKEEHFPVVDKNLLNSTRLILLDKLLPNAPIIKLVRHPLDMLISNFMNHFGSNDAWHSDLTLIAKYMLKVDEHWQLVGNKLKSPVCIVRYEDIIYSQGFTAELQQFLADVWPAKIATTPDYYKKNFVTRTASYAQVQQAINTENTNVYKHYLDCIPDDIINLITPIAKRWNYAI